MRCEVCRKDIVPDERRTMRVMKWDSRRMDSVTVKCWYCEDCYGSWFP